MPEPRRTPPLSFTGLVSATGALAGAATVIAFFGWLGWFPELFTHFRVQYVVALAAGAGVLAFQRQLRQAVIFSSLAAANVVFLVSAGFGNAPRDAAAEPSLTTLSMNVLTSNTGHERALAVIRETAADVVVLTEVNDEWVRSLQSLRADWPHMILEPREDNFGIAMLSRRRLHGAELLELAETDVPMIRATVRASDRDVVIYGIHLLPPSSPGYARLRDGQMLALARRVRDRSEPAIVVGDFNATPWSPVWRRFTAESGLRPALVGFGLCGTWPTGWPVLSIPLDHVFVSDTVRIVGQRIGPDIGSDHRPVIVTISVP